MRRSAIPLIAALCALLPTALSAAPPAETTEQDLKCLVVTNIFVNGGTDDKVKQFALIASFFYLGRLDGKMSITQIKTAADAQAKSVTAANAGALMSTCADYFRTKATALEGAPAAPAAAAKPK